MEPQNNGLGGLRLFSAWSEVYVEVEVCVLVGFIDVGLFDMRSDRHGVVDLELGGSTSQY